jgi:hypothetical protein
MKHPLKNFHLFTKRDEPSPGSAGMSSPKVKYYKWQGIPIFRDRLPAEKSGQVI